jgi:hypothetical protein
MYDGRRRSRIVVAMLTEGGNIEELIIIQEIILQSHCDLESRSKTLNESSEIDLW